MNTKEVLRKMELLKKACGQGQRLPSIYVGITETEVTITAFARLDSLAPCSVARFSMKRESADQIGLFTIVDLEKAIKGLKYFSNNFSINSELNAVDEKGKSFRFLEPVKDAPEVTFSVVEPTQILEAAFLKDALARLTPFMAESVSPLIQGVIVRKGFLEAVDGCKLFRIPAEINMGEAFTIPAGLVKFLKTAICKDASNVEISVVKWNENKYKDKEEFIKIGYFGMEFCTKKPEGRVLDTDKVIPDISQGIRASAEKRELLTAFEYMRELLKNSKNKINPVRVSLKAGEILLSDAESSAAVPAVTEAKIGDDVFLNPALVVDSIKAIIGDEIELFFFGKCSPIVFSGMDESGQIGIVMPVRAAE